MQTLTKRSPRLRSAAISLLLGVVLTGCGAGITPQQPAEAPVTGGSIVWAIENEPTTLNPQHFTQAKARLLYYNQFDSLLTRDDKGGFHPWLATSYDISPDGLAYTLKLRQDVTFHDGEAFNAHAVKANFDKLLTPGYVTGATAAQIKNLRRVEAVDEFTVRAHLSQPDILLLDFFASPRAAQVSPKSLRESPNLKTGGTDVVGTGPFILDRFVKGKEVRYTRNPAYRWAPAGAGRQGPAYLNDVTYRFINNAAERVKALTSGQAQVIEGIPAAEQNSLKDNANLRVTRQLNAGTAYSYYFNLSHAPFDDMRVRQAFREAVDVDAVLAEAYRGTATRAWSIVGPANMYYEPRFERTYGNNAARANQLLDEAGWSQRDAEGYRTRDGKRLTVRLVQSAPLVRDNRDNLARAIQASVKQSAGIDFQVRVVDLKAADEALAKNEYEVFDNSRGDTDIGVALNLIVASDAQPGKAAAANNRAWFSNPEVDGWLRKAQATSDTAQRRESYAKVQQSVVTDNAILLPLYAPADQLGAAKNVQGLGFEPVAGVPASAYQLWLRP